MKGLTTVTLLVLIGSAAWGAGRSDESGAAGREPVDVTMSIWGNETHQQMYQELLARVEESHPHITSEIILVPWGEYVQKMFVLMAANEGADIAWLADSMIPQFLDSGSLVDISDIAGEPGYDFDDILDSTLQYVREGDALYGLPFSSPPQLMYYNKSLLQEAGVDDDPIDLAERGEWDFDAFVAAARAVSDADSGTYGFRTSAFDAFFAQGWNNFLVGYGARWWNDSKTEFTADTAEGARALQLFKDMVSTWGVHPTPGDEVAFETGKVGFSTNTLRYLSTARQITDFEWSVVPVPSGPEGKANVMGYAAYTVMNDQRSQEDIFPLLKALTDQDGYAMTAQFFVPPRVSILESPDFLSNYTPIPERDARITIIDGLRGAQVFEAPVEFARISPIIQTEIEAMILDDLDPAEVLARIEEQVQPLMNR